MSRKLDKHFKCPKSLKTMFALGKLPASLKRVMMESYNYAAHTEYQVVVGERKKGSEKSEKGNRGNRNKEKTGD